MAKNKVTEETTEKGVRKFTVEGVKTGGAVCKIALPRMLIGDAAEEGSAVQVLAKLIEQAKTETGVNYIGGTLCLY